MYLQRAFSSLFWRGRDKLNEAISKECLSCASSQKQLQLLIFLNPIRLGPIWARYRILRKKYIGNYPFLWKNKPLLTSVTFPDSEHMQSFPIHMKLKKHRSAWSVGQITFYSILYHYLWECEYGLNRFW